MSSVAPANRLRPLGRAAPQGSRAPTSAAALTPKQLLLINYQIDGCPHEALCSRAYVERTVQTPEGPASVRRHPRPFEALSLIEAADVLKIRRRVARALASLPVFKQTLEAELQRYRDGERIASVRTLVEMRDDPGCGKAADRKVRLQASGMLLGELGNAGTTVNVNLGKSQITAGIVIDLREDEDFDASTRTIEHEETR